MDFYEYNAEVYSDPELPVYFSINTLTGSQEDWDLHWHEATEFLYCIEGSGVAVSDAQRIPLASGNMAIINANRLHTFYTTDFCRYCYLLVDPEMLDIPELSGTPIQPFISDPEAERQVLGIIGESQERAPFYRSEIRARLIRLFVYLYRNYSEAGLDSEQSYTGKRLEMVKAVIDYIRRHFAEPITVDSVCSAVSFSRSYVCHAFKEATGKTLVEYIHLVRCSHARTLLASRQYNVSECAEKSGFNTLSYFSKVYKKHMGVSPSAHR